MSPRPTRQGGHPFLVTGRFGQGRTAVWTSDIDPLWLPRSFVDWPGCARLWTNLLAWLTQNRRWTAGASHSGPQPRPGEPRSRFITGRRLFMPEVRTRLLLRAIVCAMPLMAAPVMCRADDAPTKPAAGQSTNGAGSKAGVGASPIEGTGETGNGRVINGGSEVSGGNPPGRLDKSSAGSAPSK